MWVIELERLGDERGWFARTFDAEEFRARGLNPDGRAVQRLVQRARAARCAACTTRPSPTASPSSCAACAARSSTSRVDLRAGSPTHGRWHGVELSAENGRALYIPAGFAHGFQTLTDDSEVLYLMGAPYVPEAARGVRWDDPAFAIEWPAAAGGRVISERDDAYPDYRA